MHRFRLRGLVRYLARPPVHIRVFHRIIAAQQTVHHLIARILRITGSIHLFLVLIFLLDHFVAFRIDQRLLFGRHALDDRDPRRILIPFIARRGQAAQIRHDVCLLLLRIDFLFVYSLLLEALLGLMVLFVVFIELAVVELLALVEMLALGSLYVLCVRGWVQD